MAVPSVPTGRVSGSAAGAIVFAVLLAGFLASCMREQTASDLKGKGKKGGGDVPVVITKAVTRDVPQEIDIIGAVEASSTVTVKPQVSGALNKVLFKEGDFVKAGDLMFEIDRRTLEAQLNQSRANLSRSEAQFHQAQANLAKDTAQADYSRAQALRYAELAREGVVSKEQTQLTQSTADAQREALVADRAAIESVRADIAANKATIENIQVQMGFTSIQAPISGRTGTLMVKMGNIVTANQTELVTINQIEPVFVSFAIPEAQLKNVASRFGHEKIEVTASPQDGGEEVYRGLLTFYENTVDASTGTIKLRGTFPNVSRKMWPGQFVRVSMRLGTIANAVVLPNQAVQTGQESQYVYVVKEDRTVELRPVTTSVRTGQDLVIASGLQGGETVVAEGQLRLAPGMRVMVRTPGSGGGPRRASRTK